MFAVKEDFQELSNERGTFNHKKIKRLNQE